eukprot:517694_1
MPRNKQSGRKRKNPSKSKPKAKKQKLNENERKSTILRGKNICITGSFELQQKDMVKLITDHGGKRDATCSKKCDYLLMNNRTHPQQCNSNKCTKAKDNNIPILREQWLYDSVAQGELLDIDDKDQHNRSYTIYWKETRTLPKYPKTIDINNHRKTIDNVDVLHKLLLRTNTRDFGMIIYFKALNRYPGGNADMYVIKYMVTVTKQWIYLQKITRSNWDGTNYISKKPFHLKVPNESNYVEQMMNAFVDLYRVKGKSQDFYAEIVDKRSDTEEYDTEWSHLDFRVYVPPKYDEAWDRMYKSDECEEWRRFANPDHAVIVGNVDDYVGDYDIEKDWLQVLCFRRNGIYGEGYGASKPLPIPTQTVSKEGEKLITVVSEFCGLMRPQNEAPIVCEESRSVKDNNKWDKDVEIKQKDSYNMPSILIKGYDY